VDVSNDERVSSADDVVSACVRWSSELNFAPETATIVHTNVLKTFTDQLPMLGTSLFRRTGTCCTEEMAEQGHHPSLLQSGRRPTVYFSATNLISNLYFTVIRLISRN